MSEDEVQVYRPVSTVRVTAHPLSDPDNLKRYLEESFTHLEDDGTIYRDSTSWIGEPTFHKPEDLIWLREYPEDIEYELREYKIVTKEEFASYELVPKGEQA